MSHQKKKEISVPTFDPNDTQVPPFIQSSIDYLLENGLEVEGIFRVSGSSVEIAEVQKKWVKMSTVDYPKYNLHTISGALKQFLRETSEPLLTFALFDSFIFANGVNTSPETRLNSIKAVLMLLPPCNKLILQQLVNLFVRIAENEATNKMSPENLSIVFTPSLLRGEGEYAMVGLADNSTNRLIESFITEYDTLFLRRGKTKYYPLSSKTDEFSKSTSTLSSLDSPPKPPKFDKKMSVTLPLPKKSPASPPMPQSKIEDMPQFQQNPSVIHDELTELLKRRATVMRQKKMSDSPRALLSESSPAVGDDGTISARGRPKKPLRSLRADTSDIMSSYLSPRASHESLFAAEGCVSPPTARGATANAVPSSPSPRDFSSDGEDDKKQKKGSRILNAFKSKN
eukprot:TRINITY_DN9277_c0_g1_i1.p1 TRINITY_DN9277_c0_g1~~TRINITY_DN9277_c0_g1_i1.p1  ORF type:complete len:399 (-),score=101.72 TRINITY_DN9277_c0_g1_i1:162-1358(-)